jgi:hypothetical protein
MRRYAKPLNKISEDQPSEMVAKGEKCKEKAGIG